MSWQNYPLFRLIIPFTLGMIGAILFISYMNIVVLFLLCCAVLALLFFLFNAPNSHKNYVFGWVAMMLFFLIGMTLYTGKHQSIERSIPQDTTFIRGILTAQPIQKTHSWALHLQQEDAHILLYVKGEKNLPTIGDTILASPTHFNPTNTCENDTFRNYNTYLFHKGICATAYAPPQRWMVRNSQQTSSIFASLKSLQGILHTIYDEHGINGEAGSIIEAMTIGRKADLSQETRTAYAHAGVSHMLALSGFHVGIIVLMIQAFFFKPLLSIRWRWVSNIFVIAILWLYAIITGLSSSLVRATLMFTILLLCQNFSREALSPHSCLLAFFIMLCINPFYIQDIGFQLSFTAVGSIGILGKRLINLCLFSNSLIHYMWLITIVAISLISTIFTAPLVAHYYGTLTLASPISNLALFCFIYLLIWTSILWWAFLWCDPINALLTDLLHWTAATMNTITESIASLPYATLSWHPDILTTCLCYVVLILLSYLFLKMKRNKPICKAC